MSLSSSVGSIMSQVSRLMLVRLPARDSDPLCGVRCCCLPDLLGEAARDSALCSAWAKNYLGMKRICL